MIKITKRALILLMGALVLIGLGIASLYYDAQDSKADPRVVEARKLYKKYDEYAGENNFTAVLLLLDSVEDIYKKYAHYQNSYEIAVIENNRAAAWLTMAIHSETQTMSLDGVTVLTQDSLLERSKLHVQNAIATYKQWLNKFENMDRNAISQVIESSFFDDLQEPDETKKQDYLENRLDEMQTAQLENKRRLSVALTNYGIILRHEQKYMDAISLYQEALELWDRNLAAKNNINILMGKPIEKRNFIQKMFPPEKDED
ncbi:MAG: hypothetical protein PF489_06575 [Salinivirgaceae bacterium]|jgi:tetratricopeptide (TPR) repeat protein|nr:hypothetical protein [Salinivirgaceae bacterium]